MPSLHLLTVAPGFLVLHPPHLSVLNAWYSQHLAFEGTILLGAWDTLTPDSESKDGAGKPGSKSSGHSDGFGRVT